MTRLLPRALLLVPLLLALVVTAVLTPRAVHAGEGPVGAAEDPWAADRVLVLGVPGLAWTDLAPERTPAVWALAQRSPIGAMSVRAARSITCVLDGWATLGAGNRARYPGPEEPTTPVPVPTVPLPEDGGDGPAGVDGPAAGNGTAGPASLCDLQQLIATVGLPDPVVSVGRIAADEGTRRFGAEPGALGAAVGCATAIGREAALAVAAPGVELAARDGLPGAEADLAGELDRCPLTVVSLDGLVETADLGPDEPGAPLAADDVSPARAAALAEVDAVAGRLLAAAGSLPGDTLVLVQGVSEIDDERPRLHVSLAAGPGFDAAGWLTSASTGRAPFVQLIDVAPTVLRALDLPVPASMNGQPMQVTGDRPALAAAVTELERANVAARAHYRSTGILFWTLVAGLAVLLVLGVTTLGRRRDPARTVDPRRRRLLRGLSLALAALPVASYLANLVPWAAAGTPRLVLLGAVLLAVAAVCAVAVAGPWRRSTIGPPLAVLAITVATLVGDVLTGSHLELDGLLGYDAIVAGRFTGYGNLTFGLLSVSALLVTAAVARRAGEAAGPARYRTAVVTTVAVCGVVTVAVIGVPALGRDFGGVLAALPGFALLGMLLTGTRVTVARLAGVLGAAVVAVGGLAVLDWLRPAGDRTHLGRFVEQVRSGEALTVVLRKAQANLDILLGSSLVWTLPTALLAAWWLARPGGLLRSRPDGSGGRIRPGGLSAADAAALRAGLLASALALGLGAAVNDSGVAVPATAAALLVPLLVWLAAAPATPAGRDAGTPAPGGAPHGDPGGGGERVTVVSRGSTLWNT